jgi:hypothetical protein
MRRRLTDVAEGLIRRAWGTGRHKMVLDQLTGVHRAPAAAFDLRENEEALSVNLESSLRAAGLPLTWSVNLNRQYAARITVGDCCANGLDAFHDPVLPSPLDQTGNPHHGLIFGLVPMRASNSDAYEAAIDALAKASTIVALT